ncbi:MAG: type II toxin-antitoxin system RelE/ParE family toxin [Bdellovibrio sp.]|nr:type II toxin-antitoxin system RelE/ParE family toxin [Bdellovibrio sp.]
MSSERYFFVYGSMMILVHIFKKKTQKTPKSDLDLAWDRMKKWVRTQKDFERALKKGSKK